MKRRILFQAMFTFFGFFISQSWCMADDSQKQTIPAAVENESLSPSRRMYTAALIVQNHCQPAAEIPSQALTDALTTKLSQRGFRVVNPNNVIGVKQNRDVTGETMSQVSVTGLGRITGAEAVITGSLLELLDSTIGDPPFLHQYSVCVSVSLADAQTGATVCGDTIKCKSPKYTNNQIAQNKFEYLNELLRSAVDKCTERVAAKVQAMGWMPTPPQPPPPPPVNPCLTLSDMDSAIQAMIVAMRANWVFLSNYDAAQKEIKRLPLVIVGGLVDLTGAKSPTSDVGNLLGAASQNIRMALVNSKLFQAKDDAVITTLTKRIIENGNNPLENGELMSVLKQHGSPDFYMVGELRYFNERGKQSYRFHLALHSLHTGKIDWEGVETIEKRKEVTE